ncbi:MAG: hypothetical protein L3J96_00695 [Thermoplasmata archaeon]|nr:hypothetical protein [Thermoplasmata archaeon]
MPTYRFRVKGQSSKIYPTEYMDLQAHDVRVRAVDDLNTIQVMEANNDNPKAVFFVSSVFGYAHLDGSTIRVWLRDPNSTGETVIPVEGTFVAPGKLGRLPTFDLLQREGDPAGPLGQMLRDWVVDYVRA